MNPREASRLVLQRGLKAPHQRSHGAWHRTSGLMALGLVLVACVTIQPPEPVAGTPIGVPAGSTSRAEHLRALTIGIEDPVLGLGDLFVDNPDDGAGQILELYHATLTTVDDRGATVPRLAIATPSVTDGTWRMNPDGTMDTIYRLRTDIPWPDGTMFTADDVLFGYAIRADPAVGAASRAELEGIDRVEIPDPSTLVVHWTHAYWAADSVREQLVPYPRHILNAAW